MKTITKRTVTIIDIDDNDIMRMIKTRVRMYERDLVSLDDLLGYLYAFEELNLITPDQFTDIVAYICNHK